jgi:hypothetical protein
VISALQLEDLDQSDQEAIAATLMALQQASSSVMPTN